ncbi:uncharacterized protein MCYG_03606 [Microsporum canis CBS 113480]|uniref:Uncharacterized protein n=1 Tax=Arthroderma otae (strain ATCC MYA-4605 / CBS 113480) TaxID=554155 RepID=C5FM65_ARTOC|nr:uncharacterized protein MCYG_03606 [Microsporum canis CBS 113480]EEQ30787.1 predicted protein [Microsporum canis CBS 113480]
MTIEKRERDVCDTAPWRMIVCLGLAQPLPRQHYYTTKEKSKIHEIHGMYGQETRGGATSGVLGAFGADQLVFIPLFTMACVADSSLPTYFRSKDLDIKDEAEEDAVEEAG